MPLPARVAVRHDPAMERGGHTVHVHGREGVPACTYCRGECRATAGGRALDGDDEGVVCGGCQAHYHADCLAELGACATLGCPAPRAGKARRVVVIQAPTCCRASGSTSGRIMLCDACGRRWHEACISRLRVECCGGHGFSPEAASGRARDRGPRVGSERACDRCSATFRVEAATRYSPHCPSCRRFWNIVGLVLMVVLGGGYLLLTILSNLPRRRW